MYQQLLSNRNYHNSLFTSTSAQKQWCRSRTPIIRSINPENHHCQQNMLMPTQQSAWYSQASPLHNAKVHWELKPQCLSMFILSNPTLQRPRGLNYVSEPGLLSQRKKLMKKTKRAAIETLGAGAVGLGRLKNALPQCWFFFSTPCLLFFVLESKKRYVKTIAKTCFSVKLHPSLPQRDRASIPEVFEGGAKVAPFRRCRQLCT